MWGTPVTSRTIVTGALSPGTRIVWLCKPRPPNATDHSPVVGSRRDPRGGRGPSGAEKTAKTTRERTRETPNFAQPRRLEGVLVRGGWRVHD